MKPAYVQKWCGVVFNFSWRGESFSQHRLQHETRTIKIKLPLFVCLFIYSFLFILFIFIIIINFFLGAGFIGLLSSWLKSVLQIVNVRKKNSSHNWTTIMPDTVIQGSSYKLKTNQLGAMALFANDLSQLIMISKHWACFAPGLLQYWFNFDNELLWRKQHEPL